MQMPSFPSVQSNYQDHREPSRFLDGPSGFFATHAVGAILRGVFLSSLLWAFLAVAIYGVYTLILGAQ